MKIIVYETLDVRSIWDAHGVDGWCIRYTPAHYRCHTVYKTKTKNEKIVRTIVFPLNKTMPTTSSVDAAIGAADALTRALQSQISKSPFSTTPTQLDAFYQLATIFDQAIITPSISASK